MHDSQAASLGIMITEDNDTGIWIVETPQLGVRWERSPAGDVRLASLRTPGKDWVATALPMFSVLGEPAMEIALHDASAAIHGDTLQLTGTLWPIGLTATIICTVYEDDSVVLIAFEVENAREEPIDIGSLTSLRLSVSRDHDGKLAMLAGGRWDESVPPSGFRLRIADLDELARHLSFGVADDGRSSGDHVPWLALMCPEGGLLAGLVWSGRWRFDIDQHLGENLMALGISDFAHRLEPGERIALPSVVIAGYEGDLDDGANAWRRWVVDHWMPPMPAGWPWIQYNHWYACYGDIDAERLLQEARLAADAGCEVFVIDDGWFRGRRPDSYFSGWGDWIEDRTKFPDGLHAFGGHARALGMKFGLWVEPERADEAGALLQSHPDWVATRKDEPIRRPGPAGPEGVHLCLGNTAVRRWMADEIVRVVREYGVDWLKWDYNMGYGLGCDASDHGHQATDGHYAHTHGLWQVLGEVRAACPDLVIENCASGGHRIDLGTLRHTHTNWVSDYTHRAASCRQHVQGAGLFLPLQHLNTWALEKRDANEFRSRMGGAFGVSSFVEEWTSGERAAFRQAVGEYKRLRPFLAGNRYLLTGPWHDAWDIWQLVHPSGDDFVVVAFRDHGAIAEIRVTPRLSAPARAYRLDRSSGAFSVCAESDLASHGIDIHLPAVGDSEIIWATAVH